MAENEQVHSFVAAEERVDAALGRMESSLRSLNGRVRSIDRIAQDVRKLENERAQLSTDLRNETTRAQKLDAAAGDVSRRLVTAMETVRSVMSTGSDIAQEADDEPEQLPDDDQNEQLLLLEGDDNNA